MIGALALYGVAVRVVGRRYTSPGEARATRRQVLSFVAGVLVLWLASDWPIHDLAEDYLYSIHMVQHMLIVLMAPPLLLLGVPAWLTRWILRPRFLHNFARSATRPRVAGVIFNVTVALVHSPQVVNFSLYHHSAHFFVHLWMFSAAMLMWFPVVNRLPEYPQLNPPLKIGYLFAMSIIPNVPVAFLAFADGVVYRYYAHVPRPWAITVIEDQQAAAAIMKVGETFYLWSIIAAVFFRWYSREESANPPRTRLPPGQPVQREASDGSAAPTDDSGLVGATLPHGGAPRELQLPNRPVGF
jgi:putative membrane protein